MLHDGRAYGKGSLFRRLRLFSCLKFLRELFCGIQHSGIIIEKLIVMPAVKAVFFGDDVVLIIKEKQDGIL